MPFVSATGTGFAAGAAFVLLIIIGAIALWIAPMIVGNYLWQAKGRKGEAEGLFFAACLGWFGVMIALTLRSEPTVAIAAATPSPLIPPATLPETLRKAV